MKVLFLSAWYPTERDAMAGLFVLKHAQAIQRQGADVRVIYSEQRGMAWWHDICRQWRLTKRQWGIPDIVQMNVLDKNGLMAVWLKRRYYIPFVIVEHWSGYLPENNTVRGGVHAAVMHAIAAEASCMMPVSRALEEGMKRHGIRCARWERIHNVVDDFFYRPFPKSVHTPKRLIHVSCFDERAKNIRGLLRAVRHVASIRHDFTLTLVGTGIDYAADQAYAQTLDFPDGMLQWTGEVSPEQVSRLMQQSDAFVLFSRYETAGVVLAECLASGLPMIGTRVGAIPEIIHEGNGILVPSGDEEALGAAIQHILDHGDDYDPAALRREGQSYTFDTVGRQLMACYRSCLSNQT